MPKPTQNQTNSAQRVTNADLARGIKDLGTELGGRLDSLETVVKDSGRNGYSPYLKEFLQQYSTTAVQKNAWQTVRADLVHRFRFLTQPKALLKALLYAVIGGIGWQIVSHFTGTHFSPFG